MLLTVHIGICDGNVHQVRGKQHNGLWLAGSAEWAALNNGAHWDQINKGYSFRWNWRNGEDETRAYLSKRLREMIFRNARMCSSKAFWNTHILDVSQPCFFFFFFFLFAVFPFCTCISEFIQQRNRSELEELKKHERCVTMYRRSVFIRSGSSSHRTLSINKTDSEYTQTKGLTNSDTASLLIACHTLSCPIIMRVTNGSLSTFLKDVLAMKLFEAQGPHINVWSHWIHFLHMFT